MAPTKSTTNNNNSQQVVMSNLLPLARKGLTRQSKQQQTAGAFNQDQNIIMSTMQTRGKRKAEASPMKNEKIKRSALGNLTNNVKVMSLQSAGGQQQGQGSKDDAVKQLKAMVKKAMHNVIDNNNSNSKDNNSNSKDNNLFGGAQQQQILQQIQILQDTQNIGGGSAAAATVTKHKITTRATSKQATTTTKTTIDVETSKLIAKTKDIKETQQQNSHQHRHNQAIGPPAAPIAPHNAVPVVKSQTKPVRRISNEFNKTEESLYMSALDFSSSESMRLSGNFEAARRRSQLLQQKEKTDDEQTESMSNEAEPEAKNISLAKIEEHVEVEAKLAEILKSAVPKIPDGVDDFDKANWNDPFQVSHYAMDIFQYLKEREKDFVIGDYMEKQIHLSKWMRSLLVDWMVEVQETFELNHETLYLAVKIVDLYLCRVVIYKDKLQLLGAAALFIACKFDERTPPLIEDFLYICDGAYKQDELLKMEMHTLRTIDYDLGIPLSYRFLRRYARCAKVPMPTLTLARYILELSLMDYATISASDSQLAAAAMFMALRLHGEQKGWTSTLEYYSGYKLADFADWVPVLNAGLHRKPKGTIKTIRSKYSHKIFHEVAKVQLLTTEQLFEHNLDLNVSMKEEKAAAATEQQQGKGSSNST